VGRGRWGIVLGSVAFHALLVALFVLDLAGKPVATPTPPMTVFLERAPVPPKATPSPRRALAKTGVAATSPIAVLAAPAAPPSSEGLAETPAPAPAPRASSLLGIGDCRLATLDRLPADERARCQERLAQAMDKGPAPRPNFDPTGRYVRDPRPYLTRPPKDGCKSVGSVKNDGPMGATSTTLAIGCARSF
jgi:hypothetical protein